jgi:phage FluMu protein Com
MMAKLEAVAASGETKRCRRCNVVLDTSEFHRFARNKGGLQHYCRSCKVTNDGALPQKTASQLQPEQGEGAQQQALALRVPAGAAV